MILKISDISDAFDVDTVSGRMFWKKPSKFHKEKTGKEAGTPQHMGGDKRYWVIRWNKKTYKRSRLIYFFVHGKWPAPCVDHINGNSLDDRPINLREATVMQNAWNHKSRSRRIKLPMGVRKITKSGRFQARIAYNKKMIHLGAYDTPEEASIAYQNKRRQLYGEFA